MPYSSDDQPLLPIPEKFEVMELITELKISYGWFHKMYYVFAVFCLFWNGFLVMFYVLLFSSGFSNAEVGWLTVCFPLIHVFAGLAFGYYTLCGFINKTTVTIDIYDITIEHHPLPWPGQRTIDKKTVDQLYVTQKISRNNKNGSSTTSYEVYAILKSGKSMALLKGLHSAQEAQFIEQKMERFLNIEDRPVMGEHK